LPKDARICGISNEGKFGYCRHLLLQRIHEKNPQNEVIWYDSIIFPRGDLKWQDELNELNKPFFDSSDGIFLNYTWEPSKIQGSAELAANKKYNVYSGVDIWGKY
jgi:mannosyl-glycoprotein endo-beta-N-acetylglucosaminidase